MITSENLDVFTSTSLNKPKVSINLPKSPEAVATPLLQALLDHPHQIYTTYLILRLSLIDGKNGFHSRWLRVFHGWVFAYTLTVSLVQFLLSQLDQLDSYSTLLWKLGGFLILEFYIDQFYQFIRLQSLQFNCIMINVFSLYYRYLYYFKLF